MRSKKYYDLHLKVKARLKKYDNLWQYENRIVSLEKKLLLIDKEYFSNYIKKLKHDLNLFNLEKYMVDECLQTLKLKNKIMLTHCLAASNQLLLTAKTNKPSVVLNQSLINHEPAILILKNDINTKINHFNEQWHQKQEKINEVIRIIKLECDKLLINDKEKKYEEIVKLLAIFNEKYTKLPQLKQKNIIYVILILCFIIGFIIGLTIIIFLNFYF